MNGIEENNIRCDRLIDAIRADRKNRKLILDENTVAGAKILLITDHAVRQDQPFVAFCFYHEMDVIITFLDEDSRPSEDIKYLNQQNMNRIHSYVHKSGYRYH